MTDSMPTLTPQPAQLLRALRRRAWIITLLRATALAALLTALLALFGASPAALLITGLAVAVIGIIGGRLAGHHRHLDLPGIAAHLDRKIPEFEDSAGLLILNDGPLNDLERLQQERMSTRWTGSLADRSRWLPPIPWLSPFLALGLAALLIPLSGQLAPLITENPIASATTAEPTDADPAELILIDIVVEPPAYTGLAPFHPDSLDLEVPEGSKVSWSFQWQGDGLPRLMLDDGSNRQLDLNPAEPGVLVFHHEAFNTAIYRLELPGPERSPADIYTLTVLLDTPPALRILEPETTSLELPRAGPAEFLNRIRVRDDYGIASVEIMASVAKGSGEGVKFRDERFSFDSSTIEDDAVIYERDWSLKALDMEPGDEIYFFAIARDNRAPTPNEARSDTVVVRWLDDEKPLIQAEGLAIDVLPEYYKSQRQIIIETEQLIADRDDLEADILDDLSRGLAQAQAELKERYGQFLGDEYGEGEGASFAEDVSEGEEGGEADDHEGHGHEEESAGVPEVDTSGDASALIERFAHDHGAADVGRITRRNPVGLMKRSLSNMWQAELHLHLSEPEKALPFEYEALKYLDLARQADRIYTRRLGFEPPPVTEERRLTGDLDDIASRERRQAGYTGRDLKDIARELFAHLGQLSADQDLPEDLKALLLEASDRFKALAGERPAMIRHAVAAERMLQANRVNPEGCENCAGDLRSAAWSLISSAETAPGRRPSIGQDSPDSPAGRYRQALEQAGETP